VLPHLRSKSWDCRSAAAQAIESICRSVGIWDPIILALPGDGDAPAVKSEETDTTAVSSLALDGFNLSKVVSEGTLLLGTSAADYAKASFGAEGLERAKKEVAARLGLGVGEDLGLDVAQELGEAEHVGKDGEATVTKMEVDVAHTTTVTSDATSATSTPGPLSPAAPLTPADEDIDMSGLSARERNVLKRKRKAEGKPGANKSSK
jgi:TATA-binding protein-associated factor